MEYLLKASVVIAIFYICYKILLQRETFFESNRWFLLLGLAIAIIFPFVVIPIHIPIEPVQNTEIAYVTTQNISQSITTNNTEPTFSWITVFTIIYSIGLLVFLLQFIFQFGSLVVLLSKNQRNKNGIYTYVIVNHKISPFSFFKWIVFNPENYNEDELNLILTHEKVHVNQLHSADILLTQLACVVFWFNPLIWLYRKHVRQNLEYIADFKTQTISNSEKAYQHLLLKTSIAHHNMSLSNNFYNSLIKERIVMLKKSRSNNKRQLKYLLILPLLAGLLLSMNTKKVYTEVETASTLNNNTAEHATTKKTTGKTQQAILKHNIQDTIRSITTKKVKVVFTKKMSNARLEEFKTFLKSNGVTMKIINLKRNNDNEIIALNIDFITDNGSTNYNVKNDKGIDSFYFKMDDNGFGVSAVEKVEHITQTIKVNGANIKSTNTISSQNANIAYGKATSDDTIYILTVDSLAISKQLKSDHYQQNDIKSKINNEHIIIYQPGITKKSILRYTNTKNKPLFFINGEEVDYNKALAVDNDKINVMEVIKGENAIEIYGTRGENGVVLIKTNNNSNDVKVLKSTSTNKEGPWKINTAVTSVQYIGHNDDSENALLLYIFKYTSDKALKVNKEKLKAIGITAKYSKIKRNKSGDLTSIKITLEDENGKKSSATWKGDDGIPDIEYGLVNGSLIARTL